MVNTIIIIKVHIIKHIIQIIHQHLHLYIILTHQFFIVIIIFNLKVQLNYLQNEKSQYLFFLMFH